MRDGGEAGTGSGVGAGRKADRGGPLAEATLGESVRRSRARRHNLLETRHRAGLRLPAHAHRHPTITLVLGGAFRESVDGRSYDCRRLDVVFKPGGIEHSNEYSEAGARCFVVEVPGESLESLADDGRDGRRRPWVDRGAVSARALWLYRRALAGVGPSELEVEELVVELVRESVRRGSWPATATEPGWLSRVRDRLRADLRRPPSLSELAGEAGVHPSHVCRAFRRRHGCTVSGYLRRLRVDAAVRRLQSESAVDLSALALALGYYDQSHFTRSFRRTVGVPPGTFRDALHGSDGAGRGGRKT